MCADVLTHPGKCESQRLMLAVLLNCLSTYFFRQHLSLNLELTISARLAGQQTPGSIYLSAPSTGLQMDPATPDFYVDFGDISPGPHDFMVGTFPSESSPSPPWSFILFCFDFKDKVSLCILGWLGTHNVCEPGWP